VLLNSVAFIAGVPRDSPASRQPQTRLGAWPWETNSGDGVGEQAYTAWAAAYPEAAKTGMFLDAPADKSAILQRFEGLSQLVGRQIALEMVTKEPILLLQSADGTRRSFEYIKGLETADQVGAALEIVQKNPRVLTVPDIEFSRTKASLDYLASSASVIDALRPLGQGGLAVFIFGSFVVLLVVLRPIFYGVNGGPSLVSMVLSPFTSLLPTPLPKPTEFLEANGINLSVVIVLYPIYVVLNGLANKFKQ